MKRFLGLTLLALVSSAISLTAQEKKTEDKKTEDKKEAPASSVDFYPLKKDSTWTYEVAGGEITVKVVGTEKSGDVDCFKLETTANGKVSASELVKVEKDGIYRYAVNGKKPDAPIRFLILPPADKATWNVDTKVEGQEIKGSFTVRPDAVGMYKDAIVVESTALKIGGMETNIKQWFAPNVGVVKLEFKLGGQEAVLTLKNGGYVPGK